MTTLAQAQIARRIAELQEAVEDLQRAAQLADSSIENGAVHEYDADGQLAQVIGRQWDGTHTTASMSGPVPPQPVAAEVTPILGGLKIRWAGDFEGGALVPMDFARVEIHLSTTGPNFTTDSFDTLVGEIIAPRGGEMTIGLVANAYYVRLVARSQSGKRSVASVPVGPFSPRWVGVEDVTFDIEGIQEAATTAAADADAAATLAAEAKQRADEAAALAEAAPTPESVAAAQSAADAANALAVAAQSKADAAESLANAAQSAANGATASANQALEDAASASATAASAASDAAAAQTAAGDAVAVADSAQAAASSAQTAANAANLAAGDAQESASEAVSLANNAAAVAATAQSTADAANSTADAAQSTADTAATAADRAFAQAKAKNLVPNGAGEFGGPGGVWDMAGVTYGTTDKPAELRGVFTAASGTGTRSTSIPEVFWDVSPGEELYIEVWLKADLPNSRIYVETRDQDGNQGAVISASPGETFAGSSGYPIANHVVPTVWTRYAAVGTVNAGATRLRVGSVYFNHQNGTERNAAQSIAIRIRRRAVNELMVDGAVTARTIAADAVVAEKIAADAVTAGKIAANAVTAGTIAAGAVVAGKLAANAVTAGNIAANAVTADKIAANAVTAAKLEALMVLSTKVYAGSPTGNHARMEGGGAAGFYVGGPNEAGVVQDAVRMGTTTGDRFAIPDPNDPSGEATLASISDQGFFSGQGLSIPSLDDAEFGGETLREIIDRLPRGPVASGFMTGAGGQWGPTTGRLGIGEVAFISEPGRQYTVNFAPINVYNTGAANAKVLVSFRYTLGGTTPTVNNGVVFHSVIVSTPNQGQAYAAPPIRTLGVFTNNQEMVRILVTIEPFSGGAANAITYDSNVAYTTPFRLWVEDAGKDIPDTYIPNNGGGSVVSPKVTYTSEWAASASESYRGNGSARTDTTDLVQGYFSSINGNGWGLVKFLGGAVSGETGKTWAQAMSGATLRRAWIYLYFNHWYYNSGGTAILRAHNGPLNNTPPTGNYVASGGWPKPGGRWVEVTPIWSTARDGLWIGPGLSTDLGYYGRANGGSSPRLRAEYVR